MHESLQTWRNVVALLVDDSLVPGVGQCDLEPPRASGEVSVVKALHVKDQLDSSFDAEPELKEGKRKMKPKYQMVIWSVAVTKYHRIVHFVLKGVDIRI